MNLYDITKINELKEIMAEDFVMLLDVYEQDSAQQIQALSEHILSQDFNAIKESAHALKGASANLGIDSMAGHAKVIEDAAKAAVMPPILEAFKEIQGIYPELKQQLSDLRRP